MRGFLFTSIIALSLFFAFSMGKEHPAVAFLQSLDQDQLKKTQFPFDDMTRESWHFLPGAMWPRPGIQLDELNEDQRKLLFSLLQASLSETGYRKTQQIIDLENVLAELEDNRGFRDPEKYKTTFYGNPATDSLWAWSFEGHHLSLNFTSVNGEMSIAPRFMGANPAVIPEGPRKGERTLAQEEDLALQLINDLSPEQREKAIFRKTAYPDIVTANATEVSPLRPAGIRMGDMDIEQQRTLLKLIEEYLSAMPADLARKRMGNLQKEELEDIYFGWAGATEMGKPHYYRVQGKTFLIEFDNTQSNANHIHTVWRDFDGDFGKDLIREHYETSGHHQKH